MVSNLYKNIDLSAKGVWFPITFTIVVLIFATAFDVFDMGNPNIVGIGDITSYGIISPCFAIIFLNFYKQENKWIYVSIFTVISFLYEIILVNLGYMNLHGWNSLFSIPVHIFSYGFWFPLHLKLMRK